jgi:hypothetical protein
MLGKTAIALTAASFAIGVAHFIPSAQVAQDRGYFPVNYPACVEDPSGAECQNAQAGASHERRGENENLHEHRRAY